MLVSINYWRRKIVSLPERAIMLGRTECDHSRVPAEASISSVHGYLYQAPANPDTPLTSHIYILEQHTALETSTPPSLSLDDLAGSRRRRNIQDEQHEHTYQVLTLMIEQSDQDARFVFEPAHRVESRSPSGPCRTGECGACRYCILVGSWHLIAKPCNQSRL